MLWTSCPSNPPSGPLWSGHSLRNPLTIFPWVGCYFTAHRATGRLVVREESYMGFGNIELKNVNQFQAFFKEGREIKRTVSYSLKNDIHHKNKIRILNVKFTSAKIDYAFIRLLARAIAKYSLCMANRIPPNYSANDSRYYHLEFAFSIVLSSKSTEWIIFIH